MKDILQAEGKWSQMEKYEMQREKRAKKMVKNRGESKGNLNA